MTTVSLQPDATAGIDNSILQVTPGNNFGVNTSLHAGRESTTDLRKGLLKFDLSSIPSGATINSATLRLNCTFQLDNSNARNVSVHRSLVEWYEGDANNAATSINGSSWNHRNHIGSIAWTGGAGGVAGTEYASSPTDTTLVGTTGADYDWNVTADVQHWINGNANYGWWLIGDSANANSAKLFASSDNATPGIRPELIIDYVSGEISGSAAGLATASGSLTAIVDISGSTSAAASATGTLAVQEMSGSAAGIALVSGTAKAVLIPSIPVWTALINNEEYDLSGGNPFWRIQATGIGLPPVRNIKQRGPDQDGSTRRGFRYDERILTLSYIFDAPNPTTADLWRDRASEIWAPLDDDEMILQVIRGDGSIRRIRGSLLGILDFPDIPTGDRMGFSQRFAVQIECADPIWWDPELHNLVFTATAGGNAGWQIPMQIPWIQQSGDAIDQIETVHYTGTHKSYPQIVVTGPAQALEITNLATGLKIKLKDDVLIDDNDVWTFDLQFGTKTVKDINGILHNGDLDDVSNISRWALEPKKKTPGGINNIRVQVPSGANENTRVQMLYYDRFTHL